MCPEGQAVTPLQRIQNPFKYMKIIYNHTLINCPSLTAAQGRGRGPGREAVVTVFYAQTFTALIISLLPHPPTPAHEYAAELRVKLASYQSNNPECTHLLKE